MRIPSGRQRVTVSLASGVGVGIVAALVGPWQMAVLVAFDVWALVQLVWLAVRVLPLDAADTETAARIEDNSRATASLAVLGSGLTSLIGVGFALVKAKQVGGVREVVITVASLVTVALAWLTVHTVFTLRYADLYYRGDVGGIEFPGADDPGADGPDYRDFAYVGFTVGMTYQVSDTDITSGEIRRAIVRHSLISFVYGTVIIGLTINVMAGFVR